MARSRVLVPVTSSLIALNLAVFVVLSIGDLGALGTDGTGLHNRLGLNRDGIAAGEWWRLVTSGFIHFGLIHVAFNCLALWNLGQMLERQLGGRRFLLLYTGSLLAGSAGVLLLERGFTITGGASGAVYGLFGAAAVALRQRGINPLQTNLGTMLLVNLALTFAVPGISIGGHLGGLAGGALCAIPLATPSHRRPSALVEWAIPVAVMVVSVVISLAVSGSAPTR